MIKRTLLKIEARWLQIKNRVLIKYFDFIPTIIPYISYGTTDSVTIQMRCVLHSRKHYHSVLGRGLRAFFSKQAPGVKIEVLFEGHNKPLNFTTDSGGYVLQTVSYNLTPGNKNLILKFAEDYTIWHKNPKKRVTAKIMQENIAIDAKAVIINPTKSVGLICDVDDTIMLSNTPSKLTAIKNLLFLPPNRRKVIPGMVNLLHFLLGNIPNSFIIYLSAGPWNQHAFIKRFIATHKYPFGPIILQDVGPDETKVFESTRGHKFAYINEIFRQFNSTKWILIGDDGQHDTQIYKSTAQNHPDRIIGILIRQLTSVQHILNSGLPFSIRDNSTIVKKNIPIIYASNGFDLMKQAEIYLPKSL